MPELLYAKRLYEGRPSLSLEEHCDDTERAARAIFREDGRWAAAWARFFRLRGDAQGRFLLNLRVASLFHDIGKANREFQELMTRRGKPSQQTLRHEHISALVLALPEVRSWLESAPELDVDLITAAVLSHHLKAADSGDLQWGQPRTTCDALRLHLGHPEIRAIFARIQHVAALPPPPPLPTSPWSLAAPWKGALAAGIKRARGLRRQIRRDDARRQLLLAVKAGVIVADSVASGIFRVDEDIERWVDEVVHQGALSGDAIVDKVIAPRIRQIEAKSGGREFGFHRFQQLAAEQGRRALLIAGCGAGKTLAAWKWAARQAQREPIGRVIFLYPTRGTATEGFRDYVGWAPEAEAALVHGSSKYELQEMMSNPPESLVGKHPLPDEREARLFALGLWPRRFFSATVDQFLSFMEHSYGGLCLLPALADSALILDEIHSYDRRMFDDLLAFLEHFDVPVLCMTATLPPDRREALIKRGLVAFPDVAHRRELADLEFQEARPRYSIAPAGGLTGAFDRALAAYRSGARVLWVVNTVARCQDVAALLREALGFEVLTYHSRFRLCDRKDAHRRTVAAFQQSAEPAIAVTTQVCEMSLDLDADMLITEVAPVTALVQRFGRSNRSSSRPLDFRADVLWYEGESHLPYTRKDLEAASLFLSGLGEGEVSQRRLAEALEKFAPPGWKPGVKPPFLTQGYYATPGSLREESDYAVTAVLNSDVEEVVGRLRRRESIDGFLLPVPRAWGDTYEDNPERPSELPRYLAIAQAKHYTPTRGFVVPKGE
jgi:CRISPR-associated endonuclease/helicase Cas3